MARLEVLEGFHCGKSFLLPEEAVLGRHPESFLCLPENRVSRQHARFLKRGTTFVVEDLNSSNGVMVQGKRLVPHLPYNLHDGDEIRICSTRMLFHIDAPPPQPARDHADQTPNLLVAEQVTKRLDLNGDGGTMWLR